MVPIQCGHVPKVRGRTRLWVAAAIMVFAVFTATHAEAGIIDGKISAIEPQPVATFVFTIEPAKQSGLLLRVDIEAGSQVTVVFGVEAIDSGSFLSFDDPCGFCGPCANMSFGPPVEAPLIFVVEPAGLTLAAADGQAIHFPDTRLRTSLAAAFEGECQLLENPDSGFIPATRRSILKYPVLGARNFESLAFEV